MFPLSAMSMRNLCYLISAPASGQGKTTITAALAARLRRAGRQVQVFKTGPDYLDPTILEAASGRPVLNLDLWIMGQAHCRLLLASARWSRDVVLVEGVMGLYDNTPHNAELARLFDWQVIVVLNVAKYAQTAKAIVAGLRNYGCGADIRGVIANFVASSHHRSLICETLGDDLIGVVPRADECTLPQRHLGLVRAAELHDMQKRIDRLADLVDHLPLDSLFPQGSAQAAPERIHLTSRKLLAGLKIAVARDHAFSFIYPMNVETLQQLGAHIVYFSPLSDEQLPACDALWLPGGYPELHLAALDRAAAMRQQIKERINHWLPVLAECGGLMYLSDAITDAAGETAAGCGVLNARVRLHSRVQRIGHQELALNHLTLRGHTFHHSTLDTMPEPWKYTVGQFGHQGEAVYRVNNAVLTYFHGYFASCPELAADIFLGAVGHG